MTTAEGFAMVRRLLALHPRKLKYVFFEAQSVIAAGTPTDESKVTERDVYWRDWESLLSGFRIFAMGLSEPSSAVPGRPFSRRRWQDLGSLLFANVRLWIRNVTNVGVGMKILQSAVDTLPPRPPLLQRNPEEPDLPSNWDGYYAMSEPMSGETLATYRKALVRAQDHPVQQAPRPMMRSELRRFAQELITKNIVAVFMVPPSLGAGRGCGAHVPPGSRIFSYDDLIRYPQFYEEENRLDAEHLNARGAEIFSRALAQEFVRSLEPAVR